MCSEYSQPGFYLGFIVWGRRPEWAKAKSFLGGPRTFFEMSMRWDAVWCILRLNFEKCYSVCTDFVTSGCFFWYSYLIYTEMTTDNIFWGEAGHFFFLGGGGSFYPSNTPDRTLPTLTENGVPHWCSVIKTSLFSHFSLSSAVAKRS